MRDIPVTKSGYLYVYVSNESNVSVFFDNLQIIHTRGPLIEENHYYSFGLTMAGISSKALNSTAENKIKFQDQEFASKEFSDGSGLDMYEFKWRMHDPQTGRFWQVDPLSEKYVYNSTYAFSENKVTSHVELEGLEAVPVGLIFEKLNTEVKENISSLAQSIDKLFSWGERVSISQEVKQKTIGATTVTLSQNAEFESKTSFNLGSNFDYLFYNGSNSGNPHGWLKSEVSYNVTPELKVEVNGRRVELENKTDFDGDRNVNNETEFRYSKMTGVKIGLGGSFSSNDKASAGFSLMVGVNPQLSGKVTLSSQPSRTSVNLEVGQEQKFGKTTFKRSFFFAIQF